MAEQNLAQGLNRWVLLMVVMTGTFLVVLDNVVNNLTVPYSISISLML